MTQDHRQKAGCVPPCAVEGAPCARAASYVYLLECGDGSFYCGWTNDLDKRLKAHNAGRGAKYTRPRRPVVLSYYEAFETKQEAMSREYAIKHMSRAEKEHLIKKTGFQRTS